MTAVLREPVLTNEVGAFAVRTRFDSPFHLVELSGELDLASHAATVDACTSPGHLNVLVDMSGLAFMDCAGYGALAAATSILEQRGGSLTMVNPAGEPLRLLTLLDELGSALCAPLRFGEPQTWSADPVPS